MTVEQYDAIRDAQGGVCAICSQPETMISRGQVQPLAVDHCHKTGRVRGLLCRRCNRAVGQLGDSEETLLKAVEYLRGW